MDTKVAGILAPLPLGLLLATLHFAVYLAILGAGRGTFVKTYTAGAFVLALSTLLLALLVYEDLLRSMFHVIGACMLILAFRYEYFRIPGNRRENAKTLMYILVCVEVCISVWVLVHAVYGLLLLAESARKWVLLNAYTAGYLFFGVLAIKSSRDLMNRRVVLNRESLTIDEVDYTPLLGSTDLRVLALFARFPGKAITCAAILADSAEKPADREALTRACADCFAEHHKATLCADYKRIYNQILKIKKILETLRVGTIVQPQNKMDIITEGWTLEVFQSVTIQDRP